MVKSGVAKKKRRVPSPLPWPPWVLKEGEGLPLVELPDVSRERGRPYSQWCLASVGLCSCYFPSSLLEGGGLSWSESEVSRISSEI